MSLPSPESILEFDVIANISDLPLVLVMPAESLKFYIRPSIGPLVLKRCQALDETSTRKCSLDMVFIAPALNLFLAPAFALGIGLVLATLKIGSLLSLYLDALPLMLQKFALGSYSNCGCARHLRIRVKPFLPGFPVHRFVPVGDVAGHKQS